MQIIRDISCTSIWKINTTMLDNATLSKSYHTYDTPLVRAIEASHTACKDQILRKNGSHWSHSSWFVNSSQCDTWYLIWYQHRRQQQQQQQRRRRRRHYSIRDGVQLHGAYLCKELRKQNKKTALLRVVYARSKNTPDAARSQTIINMYVAKKSPMRPDALPITDGPRTRSC